MTGEEVSQAFDGLMLGDGSLARRKKGACYGMHQSKPTISISDHLRWLQWVAGNVFPLLGVVPCGSHPKARTRIYPAGKHKGESYQEALLYSRTSSLLGEFYDEWYSGGEWTQSGANWYIHGKTKVLPRRLMQAATLPIWTLVHWFLGDGSSVRRYINGYGPYVQVSFSTNCFSVSEVLHLMGMLNNIGVTTTKPSQRRNKRGSGLVICLSSARGNSDHFMDLVEPGILEIFKDSESPSYKDMVKRREPL